MPRAALTQEYKRLPLDEPKGDTETLWRLERHRSRHVALYMIVEAIVLVTLFVLYQYWIKAAHPGNDCKCCY